MSSWLKTSQKVIKELEEAVNLYNRLRYPEAYAEIVRVENDKIYVKFTGDFCETCAVNDWVEDFVYTLEDVGIEAILEEIIEPKNPGEMWRIGIFKVLR